MDVVRVVSGMRRGKSEARWKGRKAREGADEPRRRAWYQGLGAGMRRCLLIWWVLRSVRGLLANGLGRWNILLIWAKKKVGAGEKESDVRADTLVPLLWVGFPIGRPGVVNQGAVGEGV